MGSVARQRETPLDRASGLASGQNLPLPQLSAHDRAMFEGGGRLTRALLIARRGEMSFYRVYRSDGRVCFALGTNQAPGLFDLGMDCPSYRGQRLISRTNPVILFSTIDAPSRRSGFHRLTLIAGFAADGIRAVGMAAANGRRFSAPVIGNTFSTRRLAARGAVALQAWDSRGRIVWEEPLPASFRSKPPQGR